MTYPEFQINEEKILSLCESVEKKSEPLSVLNKIGNHAKKIAVTAAMGRPCTQAWPPSGRILGTIVFRALG